jgi:energy-coupling factor transport system permease protein
MWPVYRHKDTLVHGLHPVPALLLFISIAAAALALENPLYTLTLCAGVLSLMALAEVWREAAAFLRAGAVMALLVAAINPLVNNRGEHVLVYGPAIPLWGRFDITLEAVLYGLAAGARLFAVVAVFGLMTLAVSPDDLLDLLSRLSLRSSLSAALAVRLYPGMVAEAREMREVQLARGERLRGGGRWARARASLPLWRTLFQGSLDRAAAIAESMAARGFGSRKRTRYKPRRLLPRDLLAVLAALMIGAAVLTASVGGKAGYSFFPSPANPLARTSVPAWAMLAAAFLYTGLLCGSWKRWHWLKSRI